MNIEGAVALVTGANRGIGRCIVEELARRGARRIYAAMRHPPAPGTPAGGAIEPVRLDVTDAGAVARAAARCADVTLLVNNTGVNSNQGLIAAPDLGGARAEMEVNYFGALRMCRAFAPVLGMNGGGTIVNVLSITARLGLPAMGSLCASKAAALRMTECVRAELAAQGTAVMAFLPAAVDTDMTRDVAVAKESPQRAAQALCDGVEHGVEELPFGARAEYVVRMLQADPARVVREYAALLPK